MIKPPEYLALGSIVTLKGSEKKLMVLNRALLVDLDGNKREYYDYSFCFYPEGLIGDNVIYSNHDCIDTVLFEGHSDDEDIELMKAISAAVMELNVEKGNPNPDGEW